MFTFLINIFYLIFFIITSLVFFLIASVTKICTFAFDKRLVILHRFASLWSSFYLWLAPNFKVEIFGREKIRRDATYVVVANHQSMVDIMLGYRLFFHFKWVAKEELLKVPFIGWNMLLNRYVFVKRGDRQSILDMMKASEAHLRMGSSIFIFPEGTRSPDGEVQDFKAGAFSLAKRVGVPILPIAIKGSIGSLPKGQFYVKGRHHMEITVLDEVSVDVVAEKSAKELANMTRTAIADHISDSAPQLIGEKE